MLVVFVAMAWFTRRVYDTFGVWNLLYAAIAVFAVAWIAQFVGHSKLFEGRKPSFFTDLRYLLIGPIGRAHVCTTVTTAPPVCRSMLDKTEPSQRVNCTVR